MDDSLQLIAVKRVIKGLDIDSLMKLMLFTTEEYDLVTNIIEKARISIENKFNRVKRAPSEWKLIPCLGRVDLDRDGRRYFNESIVLEYAKSKSIRLIIFASYKQNFRVDENNGEFSVFIGNTPIHTFGVKYDFFVKILSGKVFSGKITDEEAIKRLNCFKSQHCDK